MKSRLTRLLGQPNGRYVFIGGLVYLLELIVIFVAQGLGAGAVLSVGLSFWIGLVVSFILQKLVTFNDKRMGRHILLPQLFAFSLLVLFNFGFTVVLTKILSDTLPTVVTRTLALAMTTIWNFYLYKTRIFRTGREDILID